MNKLGDFLRNSPWAKIITYRHTKKITFGALLLVLGVYFWPQYVAQVPLTQEQTKSVALAQLSQVPATAPLELITQPNDGMGGLLDAINGAKTSVDLVIYELDDQNIEQSLVNAKNRGIVVRVILQNINNFGKHPNQSAYDFLKNSGVPIIWAQKYFTLTHQKTLIIDQQRAFIMTFNLVSKYYATSRDFGIIDYDKTDIAAIEAVFDSDWSGRQKIADNGNDLVWSPGSAPTLLALINSAQTLLDIYTLEMDEPDITLALEQAAARGVNVRVNMTYATAWKKVLGELVSTGVHVRTYPSTGKFFIHAKVIIADNNEVFIGSENFSLQSLNLNRELGIILVKPNIISALENTFEHDWAGSRPFVPK